MATIKRSISKSLLAKKYSHLFLSSSNLNQQPQDSPDSAPARTGTANRHRNSSGNQTSTSLFGSYLTLTKSSSSSSSAASSPKSPKCPKSPKSAPENTPENTPVNRSKQQKLKMCESAPLPTTTTTYFANKQQQQNNNNNNNKKSNQQQQVAAETPKRKIKMKLFEQPLSKLVAHKQLPVSVQVSAAPNHHSVRP